MIKVTLEVYSTEIEMPMIFGYYEINDNTLYSIGRKVEFRLGFLNEEEKLVFSYKMISEDLLNHMSVFPLEKFGWRLKIYKFEVGHILKEFNSNLLKNEVGTTDPLSLMTWLRFELLPKEIASNI